LVLVPCWLYALAMLMNKVLSIVSLLCCLQGCVGGLTFDSLPSTVKDVQYAVRGEIVQLAQDLKQLLQQPDHGLPFDEITPCNIGNPQALGQPPISFHRQVLSLLTNPELQKKDLYASDVQERAQVFTNATSFGAYSHSKGVPLLRQYVADFISRRDGTHLPSADPESIYLTDGASPGVKLSLEMLVSRKDDGVLIPVPQYPLYSAAITNNGGSAVGYYLDEASGWSVSIEQIKQAMARFHHEQPAGSLKGIAVINPGNPTGNVMTRAQMEEVVQLCADHRLVLLADEVYQENIWAESKPWESFRKVVLEMQAPVQVISFHSISKGYYGECGLRGGYMQLHNIDQRVQDQFYKMASITLCSNTLGQAMTASIMNPPRLGDASFARFEEEKTTILKSLRRKSLLMSKRLNTLPGMSCQPSDGAMYAFPRVDLPRGALAAAAKVGKQPDEFYCISLLNATGIIVVPGSGFHQRPGTWHFRITILPSEAKLPGVLDRFEAFHRRFMSKYSASEL